MTCSVGEDAETLSQKDSRSRTASPRSFLKSAYQTKRAQIAPPEVPLRATISFRLRSSARSRLSTPAAKAEWLPPPWHAIATRLVLPRFRPLDLLPKGGLERAV